ncbi:hypothetical protein Tco_0087944 [Tanacetum coccineum]
MTPATTARRCHWKRNCPVYLAELLKKKKQVGSGSSSCIFTIELFAFALFKSWVLILVVVWGCDGLVEAKNVINQEVSERAMDLEEIQDEDTSPSKITSEIPMEVEGFEPPQEEVIPVRRFERTHRAPDDFVLNVEAECFAMKDLGEAIFILGIKIYKYRSKRLIGLGENAYMDKILRRYKMDNSKRGHIPMQERLDLNKTQGASTPKEVKRMQNVPYTSAVGSIMCAVRCTRPDVAFANSKDMFSVYGGNPEAEIRVDCYCNAGFETDIDDTKSLTGYVLFNYAASEAEMEAVWIRKFISGLGIVPTINEPIKMFCDNSAALLIANELGVQMGARHYHRSNLLKVHTDDNLAYPFMKALPKGKLT